MKRWEPLSDVSSVSATARWMKRFPQAREQGRGAQNSKAPPPYLDLRAVTGVGMTLDICLPVGAALQMK